MEHKLEKCDGCRDWFPLRDLTLHCNQLLCRKCLSDLLSFEQSLRVEYDGSWN